MFLKELPIVQQKDAEARHKLATTNQTEPPPPPRIWELCLGSELCNDVIIWNLLACGCNCESGLKLFSTLKQEAVSLLHPMEDTQEKGLCVLNHYMKWPVQILRQNTRLTNMRKWKRTPQDSSEIYNLLGKPDCESWVTLMEDIVSSVLPRRGGIWTLANFIEGRNKKVGSKGKEVSPEGRIMIYQGSPLLSGKY